MPWRAFINPTLPFIEAHFEAQVTPDELFASVREVFSLAQRHATARVLVDCTALRGGHSVFDIYTIVHALKLSDLGSTLREAILCPAHAEAAEMVRFWETACANCGLLVRIFHDRQLALDWLLLAQPHQVPAPRQVVLDLPGDPVSGVAASPPHC